MAATAGPVPVDEEWTRPWAEEWERMSFYEYRIEGIRDYRFRCPVCHDPLRVGLELSVKNYPEEEAGDLFEGTSKHNPSALICRKPECRALLRLST